MMILITDSLAISEAFKHYCSYNFTHNYGCHLLDDGLYGNGNTITVPNITEDIVRKAIQKVKETWSIGSDKISNYIIRGCSSYFIPILCIQTKFQCDVNFYFYFRKAFDCIYRSIFF